MIHLRMCTCRAGDASDSAMLGGSVALSVDWLLCPEDTWQMMQPLEANAAQRSARESAVVAMLLGLGCSIPEKLPGSRVESTHRGNPRIGTLNWQGWALQGSSYCKAV